MPASAADRLGHIKGAIATIRTGLKGMDLDALEAHPIVAAGFRYELLVISEAARHVPVEWKRTLGLEIDWRRLEDLGNRLRHAYHDANAAILWKIYENDLDPLETAIDRMLAAHPRSAG
jgi:uncharacterized protein with HEPN domain